MLLFEKLLNVSGVCIVAVALVHDLLNALCDIHGVLWPRQLAASDTRFERTGVSLWQQMETSSTPAPMGSSALVFVETLCCSSSVLTPERI